MAEDDTNCTCSPNLTSSDNCSNMNCTKMGAYFTEDSILLLHTLYVAVLCSGIFGNMLTCTVILMRRSMRRSIHFYTFNLALCDLLILFFYVPTQMVYVKNQLEWTMGLTMCKVAYVVLPVSLVSSIGTLLAITIDRARGLIQPFKWRADSQRNAKLIIPTIWFIAILTNIPLFIFPRMEYDGSILVCSEGWPQPEHEVYFWVFVFVLVFAIPLVVIVVTHVIMISVMMRDSRTVHRQHNKRMIRMVIALVLVFSICTGFQHVYFFLATFSNISLSLQSSALLFGMSNFVVSLQASLNPIIYGTLRQDFKKAFKAIILKLMVAMKLRRDKSRRGKYSLNYSSIRTNDFSGNTEETFDWVKSNMDSPLTSPRHSYNFNNGSHISALLRKTNMAPSPTLRKNLFLKNIHERDMITRYNAADDSSFISNIVARRCEYTEYMCKRISKIFEHLNQSKETIL
ncbi:pyroglutamylated RF-amide peptide receptor-like [Hydractinia symbiolongicarpus]|uniref:pyroglutamylated RF-amide peptide receptor-like n=1 Tax=Hydractinia symbiolongicarpus TaxID=13093 RepID=UPI00254A38C0|nr:pyroglutamylated RF-amide peptide receptor-like [Hydractinia symbiolongicarpus]